jgi:hypothetical protein
MSVRWTKRRESFEGAVALQASKGEAATATPAAKEVLSIDRREGWLLFMGSCSLTERQLTLDT